MLVWIADNGNDHYPCHNIKIRKDAKLETVLKKVQKVKNELGITGPVKVMSYTEMHNIKRGFWQLKEYYTEPGYVEKIR